MTVLTLIKIRSFDRSNQGGVAERFQIEALVQNRLIDRASFNGCASHEVRMEDTPTVVIAGRTFMLDGVSHDPTLTFSAEDFEALRPKLEAHKASPERALLRMVVENLCQPELGHVHAVLTVEQAAALRKIFE